MKIIAGPNLFLFPFSQAHADLLSDWLPTKQALRQWSGTEADAPSTVKDTANGFTAYSQHGSERVYSISLRSTGMLAGHGAIRDIDTVAGTGRLARILLAPVFRGQGLGKEVTALLCTAAFDIVGLSSLTLRVKEDNTAAISSFLACGFEFCASDAIRYRIGSDVLMVREMVLELAAWKKSKPGWAKAMRKGEDCCDH